MSLIAVCGACECARIVGDLGGPKGNVPQNVPSLCQLMYSLFIYYLSSHNTNSAAHAKLLFIQANHHRQIQEVHEVLSGHF